jgi:xanthomonalisin
MVGMYRPSSSWNTKIANFKFDDCGTSSTTYAVSGTITTSAGTGLGGVTVSTGTVSTTTGSGGTFTLSSLANGSYTITPSLSGYSFSPTSRSVTVSGGNVGSQNFTATATTSNTAPTANFSFTTSGLVATFNDSSSDSDGTIASHAWTFGDGGTSTSASPSHTYASSGTYSVTETVTDDGGLSASKTSSVTVSGGGTGGNVLSNGVTVSNLAASTGAYLKYTMVVPAGATGLKFVMSGGTGDADMYVKFGSEPTDSSYDCRPYVNGNSETCSIATAQAGTYYINIKGYQTFSGVSLTGSYSTGGGGGGSCGGTVLCSGVEVALPSKSRGGVSSNYTLVVPAGSSSAVFTISGGTGDADLYVKLGSAPTTSSYNCRPYLTGNNETCTFNAPTAGTYYVNVRAYAAYSGVSLKGTVSP